MLYKDHTPTHERGSGRTLRMVETLVKYCKTHRDSTILLVGHNEDFVRWYLFPMLMNTLLKRQAPSQVVLNRKRILTVNNNRIRCLSASSLSDSPNTLRGLTINALFEDHVVREFLTTEKYECYYHATYPQLKEDLKEE